MKYRSINGTGLKVSEISLGSWITLGEQMDEKDAISLVQKAFDEGVNYFDTADEYAEGRAETVLGKAIKSFNRESCVISTKVWAPTMEGPNGRGLSRKHIMESCVKSLERLGTDYIDIYFCHAFDPDTPIIETVQAMDDLIHQGKVLYWGTSNWKPEQFNQAQIISRENNLYRPVVEQPEFNLFNKENVEQGFFPLTSNYDFGLVTYSPLKSGLLSGKYREKIPENTRLGYREWLRDTLLDKEKNEQVRRLSTLSKKIGISLAQMAIAWILLSAQISSVISGASREEQLMENLKAGDHVHKLTSDIVKEIEEILTG